MHLVNTVFVIITSILTFAVTDRFMSEAPAFKVIIDVVFIGINLALWGYVFLDKWFDCRLLNVRQHVDNDLTSPLNHSQYRRFVFFKSPTARSAFKPSFSRWTIQIFLMLQGVPCDQLQCRPRRIQLRHQESLQAFGQQHHFVRLWSYGVHH